MNFCYEVVGMWGNWNDSGVCGPVSTGLNEDDRLDWIAARCLADYAEGDRSVIDNWTDEAMNPCDEDEGLFDDLIVTIYAEDGRRELGKLEYYAPDSFREI